MNNKLNDKLQEFFKENNVTNISEAYKKLPEFIELYESGKLDSKNTESNNTSETLKISENKEETTE